MRGLDLGELDGEFSLDELFRDAKAVESCGRVAVLDQDADQKMLGPDVVVAKPQGGSQCLLEGGLERVNTIRDSTLSSDKVRTDTGTVSFG
jgi:hypothetical protein